MLARGVADTVAAHGRDPRVVWGDLLTELTSTDTVVANLQCAITDHLRWWSHSRRPFLFKAPPEATAVLSAGNVGMVSLANNHALDYEEKGLRDTLRHLAAVRIAYAGAGRDLGEAIRPAVKRIGSLSLGLVAVSEQDPEWAAGPGKAGVYHLPLDPNPGTLRQIERSLAAARRAGADFVVFSMHWGHSYQRATPTYVRELARAAVDRGADLVYGHGPQTLHGIEVYDRTPILYSAGSLLDDYAVDPVLRNDLTAVFLLQLREARVERLRIVPVRRKFTTLRYASGADLDEVADRLIERSAELDTVVTRSNRVLEVDCAAGSAESTRKRRRVT